MTTSDTTSPTNEYEIAATDPLLLPEAPPRFGPMSRRLLARLGVALALLQILGAVLIFAVGTDTARALGASLVFPGGGLLYGAMPIAFVATIIAMVVALVLWWGVSAHLAIPLVWIGSAVVAAALIDGPRLWWTDSTTWPWAIPVAYALVIISLAAAAWRVERRYRDKRARIPELNEYLATVELHPPEPRRRAPDEMDAELLRWCYDLAEQPEDGLVGLDWGEQFHGGTQLRYQLNGLCWALSVYAANFVPNAPGHIESVLSRMIDKHTDLRVWRYWRTLNLLGNFDPNPDPITRDNIMFSAFLGDVINMYEAATGSDRYDQHGSLTFVWRDGRSFAYDHHSITAAVRRNYERSRLGFFPCEPGWSFTVCNIMGAQSLYGHDTLHGTNDWDEVRPRWVRTLEQEYQTPDGSYAHIRSNHVGLSWDTGEVPGGHYYTHGTNRFADILPRHARRAAALELRGGADKIRALATMVVDGTLTLELPEEPERHRTRSSALPAWNKVIGAARAIGEHDLAEAAMAAAARQCGTGQRWPDRPLRSGISGLSAQMLIRWSAPVGTAALNQRGYVAPTGPVLTAHDRDRVLVLVARPTDSDAVDAVARDDRPGSSVELELVLEPRGDGGELEAALTRLRFGSLAPNQDYELRVIDDPDRPGRLLTADADGTAEVTLELPGRTELRLAPRSTAGGTP